jgi:hypothetical protein
MRSYSSTPNCNIICIGNQSTFGGAEWSYMVGVDLPRCWPCPCPRRRLDSASDAAEYHNLYPRIRPVVVPCRREYLVPQTSRVFDGILGCGSYDGSLCQFFQRRKTPCVPLMLASMDLALILLAFFRGTEANCCGNPLHPAWRCNGALPSPDHGPHVYDGAEGHPQAVLRNLLVHPPPRVLLHARPLCPCDWMLRP